MAEPKVNPLIKLIMDGIGETAVIGTELGKRAGIGNVNAPQQNPAMDLSGMDFSNIDFGGLPTVANAPVSSPFGEYMGTDNPADMSTGALLAGLGMGFLPTRNAKMVKGAIPLGQASDDVMDAAFNLARGKGAGFGRPKPVITPNPPAEVMGSVARSTPVNQIDDVVGKVGKTYPSPTTAVTTKSADEVVEAGTDAAVEAVEKAKLFKNPLRWMMQNKGRTAIGGLTGYGLLSALTGGNDLTPEQQAEADAASNFDPAGQGGTVPAATGQPAAPASAAPAPEAEKSIEEQIMDYLEKRRLEQEPSTLEKIGNTMMTAGFALDGTDTRGQHRQSALPNRTPEEQFEQALIPQLLAFVLNQNRPVDPVEASRIRNLNANTDYLNSQAVNPYAFPLSY